MSLDLTNRCPASGLQTGILTGPLKDAGDGRVYCPHCGKPTKLTISKMIRPHRDGLA